MKLDDQERQQRGEEARAGVDREVGDREEREPGSDELSHQARDDNMLALRLRGFVGLREDLLETLDELLGALDRGLCDLQ